MDERDVAGAGGQVDDERVERRPVHVGDELLERLVQHRSAPDDRLVIACEEPHRDELHAVRPRRDDDVVDEPRRVVDAEHAGQREAPHVRVEDPDPVAASGQGDGQVGAHRRLAHPALPGRDGEHPGGRVGERVPAWGARRRLGRGVDDGERVGRRVAPQHRRGAGHLALVHRSPLEGDRLDARLGEQRGADPVLELVGRPAVLGECEREADPHPAVAAVDAGEHPEVDDREAQLGILDPAQHTGERGVVGHATSRTGFPLRA